MLVLQSSCTNATSSAPRSSTIGVENWFADEPVPLAPGASGTIAVWPHDDAAESAVGIASVYAACTGQ